MIHIGPLASIDEAAIDALLDRAFGVDRHARTAYSLRAGTRWIPALSFAALDDGRLAGTLQSWPVRLGADPLVMVGPVAVEPDRQQAGIGQTLMHALTAAADAAALPGADALMMIGDPGYYERFGFTAAATGGWALPGPVDRHRLLARLARPVGAIGEIGPRTDALVG